MRILGAEQNVEKEVALKFSDDGSMIIMTDTVDGFYEVFNYLKSLKPGLTMKRISASQDDFKDVLMEYRKAYRSTTGQFTAVSTRHLSYTDIKALVDQRSILYIGMGV